MTRKNLSSTQAAAIFIGFTAYFYFLLFTLLPFLKNNVTLNPALYWFITAYFLFIPLFVFAVSATRQEGNTRYRNICRELDIKKFTKVDWVYSLSGLMLAFALTGVIFGLSAFLSKYFVIRELSTTPWFMEMHPFQGKEKLLLVVWFPMFFFNIVGEEILWRGYIQKRMTGKYTWLICSALWMVFHLPFGLDLMIMLIPIVLIVPYVYSKTGNTVNGIFIHGLYNGPIFVLVALGFMK